VPNEISVLALMKGRERYIYVSDDASLDRLVDAIREQAANPGLSLSWFDAAVLATRARQQALVAAMDTPAAPNQG